MDSFTCSCPPHLTGDRCECYILGKDDELDCNYSSNETNITTSVEFSTEPTAKFNFTTLIPTIFNNITTNTNIIVEYMSSTENDAIGTSASTGYVEDTTTQSISIPPITNQNEFTESYNVSEDGVSSLSSTETVISYDSSSTTTAISTYPTISTWSTELSSYLTNTTDDLIEHTSTIEQTSANITDTKSEISTTGLYLYSTSAETTTENYETSITTNYYTEVGREDTTYSSTMFSNDCTANYCHNGGTCIYTSQEGSKVNIWNL